MAFSHIPVMAREVVELLGCAPGRVYVDGTLGGGGHTAEILKSCGPDGRVVGIDRDADAIDAASRMLRPFGGRAVLVQENFSEVKNVLEGLGIERVDGIVLDLGVSSFQLDTSERGFSFTSDAPLDMRMDRSSGDTARDLVNGLEATELERIFREYGEERFARRISRAIERSRKAGPIETTGELARIITEATPRPRPGTRHRIHPATRVFQALRIAVNRELESLVRGLNEGMEVLKSGGRFVVISFHSLEDRIVKKAFREFSTGCICPPRIPVCVCGHTPVAKLVTRKALRPSDEEVESNPRARSAKLRAIEKL